MSVPGPFEGQVQGLDPSLFLRLVVSLGSIPLLLQGQFPHQIHGPVPDLVAGELAPQ